MPVHRELWERWWSSHALASGDAGLGADLSDWFLEVRAERLNGCVGRSPLSLTLIAQRLRCEEKLIGRVLVVVD